MRGSDPIWRAYWNGTEPGGELRNGRVIRTVHECLQTVLRNGSVGLAPLAHELPDGPTAVPLADMPPAGCHRVEQR